MRILGCRSQRRRRIDQINVQYDRLPCRVSVACLAYPRVMLPPRFNVTAGQIELVVKEFYRRARNHAVLGPIFTAKVADWPQHETKIIAFWANAILHQRDYQGNPMQVHKAAGNVHAGHFAQWLSLFDAVLHEALDETAAKAWSALAHRIGAGLRFGLAATQPHANGAPDLGTGEF